MTSDGMSPTWLAETSDAVRLAKSTAETERQLEDLTTTKAAFSDLNTSLRNSVLSASALRSIIKVSLEFPPNVRQFLDEGITETSPRRLIALSTELTRFNDDSRRSLIAQWQRYASNQIGDVTGLMALTNTLAELEGVSDLAERLRAELESLARAQENLPSTDSINLLSTVQQSLGDLEDFLQPASVREFFSSVARGGAPVTSLTKEVAQWLTNHNALQDFKIVAGSPTGSSDG